METLGSCHPSFWIHDDLLEQQTLRKRSFCETPVDHFAGLVSERMHSDLASLGHNGSALEPHTELPCTTPPMATPELRGQDAGEENVRKLHKADRERLRRDHLNEQFAKLAGVLDPIRPKLDKGTILAESILAVNELRSDIARMKSEHLALSEESRDLSQEKAELQEEKTLLETEVGRLQDQRNQSGDNQSAATGWRMDQLDLVTNPQFPCPVVPSMTKSSLPSKDTQDLNSFFFSAAPFSTLMHPTYQTYGMFGSSQSPYMPPTHFPHPGQQIHVERPAARYPALIHPTPIYPAVFCKNTQAKASDLPIVGTDLQLQTPSLTIQHSVSEHEQLDKTKLAKGQALDMLGDSGIDGSNAASADEQLASQLSLSPSFH